jgi:hypothetical protein
MKKVACLFIIFLIAVCSLWAEPYKFGKVGLFGGIGTSDLLYLDSNFSVLLARIGVVAHLLPLISLRVGAMQMAEERETENLLTGDPPYVSSEDEISGFDIAALVHLFRTDSTSFYFGPSVFHIYSKSKDWSWSGGRYLSGEGQDKTLGYGIVLGGQYLFNPRFAAFIDSGYTFLNIDSTDQYYNSSGVKTNDTKRTTSGSQFKGVSLGFVFYFN